MNHYRSEIKFICYQHNYHLLKNWIKLHQYNFLKEYNDRYINNIYFDSNDYKAFNDNLTGLPSRLKVRYRWYGDLFSIESKKEGSLEFKFRKNVYGYKKIFKVKDLTIDKNCEWKSVRIFVLKLLQK